MRIARKIADLQLDRSQTIGLVPTMGFFHEGHLSLMRKARAECNIVVASLFVNPTQFGPKEDFSKYPRNEQRDFDLARQTSVDVMFAPSTEEMYDNNLTSVRVAGITEKWEGAFRPGHFDGVATIVLKLLNIVRPDITYFGVKDLQQCAVIRQMVRDLNVDTKLSLEPTVREADGLAMSSRNAYLSEREREIAPRIHQALSNCAEQCRSTWDARRQFIDQARKYLSTSGFRVDYLEAVDSFTFEPATRPARARLIVAAWLGNTRLIDNVGIE